MMKVQQLPQLGAFATNNEDKQIGLDIPQEIYIIVCGEVVKEISADGFLTKELSTRGHEST